MNHLDDIISSSQPLLHNFKREYIQSAPFLHDCKLIQLKLDETKEKHLRRSFPFREIADSLKYQKREKEIFFLFCVALHSHKFFT